MKVQNLMTQQEANISGTGSSLVVGATWVADLAMWVQIGASVVAIVFGVVAIWFKIEKSLTERKLRQDK